MNTALIAACLLAAGASGARAGEVPVTEAPSGAAAAKAAVAARLTFTPPPGWAESAYANAGGADPVVKYERGADGISIRLYGGAKGTFYKTPDEFLSGPGATTMGAAPVVLGSVKIGRRAVPVYRHQFPIPEGDPHAATSRAPRMATEIFCVLPPSADGRFAVLAYARESPIPELDGRGEKAWRAFLSGVKPVAEKKTSR